ncbi:MAG: 7-carboxy-7-deazaguanine synthase QueE [Cyclobacteriaceae bacterium]|nr:7-carboxy-7-deazaguanine synthase QueE [Cyclobacteriaceae bacterium]
MRHVYPVMETFYSIQGEGYHAGESAYFIRLAGCDVGCTWCDVKESWSIEKAPKLSVEELVEEVLKSGAVRVIITGGEPTLYDLAPLTELLQNKGIQTHLETSAAYPITGKWDWICVSPKKFKAPITEELLKANELKVVVFNKSDFKWAEQHAEMVDKNCLLFLQPEWDKTDVIKERITEYVKNHPTWRISLQIHKYLNVR